MHLIGWLSLHHLVLFLELWSVLSYGPYVFASVCLLCCKGLSLRYALGWGNPHSCIVALYVGEGSEKEQSACLALAPLSITFPAAHKQTRPFWFWFLDWWTCVCSWTLWVSPMNSPVRLGVSPTAATPTGFYNQMYWGSLFLCWHPGLRSLSRSPVVHLGLSLHKCGTTWSSSNHLAAHPLCPCYPSPPLLSVWMNVSSLIPWLSDFYTVQFSGSSSYFLFLSLLLSFFWLCKEAKCMPPSCPEVLNNTFLFAQQFNKERLMMVMGLYLNFTSKSSEYWHNHLKLKDIWTEYYYRTKTFISLKRPLLRYQNNVFNLWHRRSEGQWRPS